MAIFVHLTPEKNVSTILRTGITRFRRQDDHPGGIFAMPAARSFYVSHQWLAELKERGHLRVAGLYFHIPDSEMVWVGHYHGSHRRMTAADATALFIREQRPRGFEVIVPRAIRPREIHRIHHLAQVFPIASFTPHYEGIGLCFRGAETRGLNARVPCPAVARP